MNAHALRLDERSTQKFCKYAIKGRTGRMHRMLDPLIEEMAGKAAGQFEKIDPSFRQQAIENAKKNAFEMAYSTAKSSKGAMDNVSSSAFFAKGEMLATYAGTVSSVLVGMGMLLYKPVRELVSLLHYLPLVLPAVGIYMGFSSSGKAREKMDDYRYEKEQLLSHLSFLISTCIEGAFTFEPECRTGNGKRRQDGHRGKNKTGTITGSFNGNLTVEEAREVLGVSSCASKMEIRKAFTRMAMQIHPDKNGNIKDTTEQMQVLNRAYEKLTKGK